jgi:hypothetical protein
VWLSFECQFSKLGSCLGGTKSRVVFTVAVGVAAEQGVVETLLISFLNRADPIFSSRVEPGYIPL